MADHNETGSRGEQLAVEFLKENGHEILAQQFRFGRAEIDIVSQVDDIIVFTEVKTRSSNKYGYPEEFVDAKKVRLLKTAAEEYVYQNQWDGEVRFDVVAVTFNGSAFEIHHITDAFFYEEE